MIRYPLPSFSDILLWLPGKADPSQSGAWLPAWRHMLDTALVMQGLLRQWLPQGELELLQGELSEEEAERIASLAALLHDMGKLTPVFVAQLTPRLPEINSRLNSLGLPVPAYDTLIDPGKSPHALAGAVWLSMQGCPPSLAAVIAAHHGKPPSKEEQRNQLSGEYIYPQHYFGKKGRDSPEAGLWDRARDEWLQYALKCCGYTSLSEVPPISKASQMLLSGLLIMADWIASNQQYFPLLAGDAEPVCSIAPERAAQALEAIALPRPLLWDQPPIDSPSFYSRFGFQPNDVQQAVLDTILTTVEPGLIILEAQMGVGKTEAALAAAEYFAQRRGAGGVFFGLPTQATANGLFPRLMQWAGQLSEECRQSIRLAHGMANMNQSYAELLHGNAHTENGEPQEGLMVHSWFEGRKKALLANFVIGTVDQLLLAALKQRHVMLRHLGLAGKVVIIDECHAYDAYMNVYLERALSWLGAYHVPVLLLSATLPAQRRYDLIKAYLGREWPGEQCFSRAYPLLTWTDGGEVYSRAIPLSKEEKKRIQICRLGRESAAEYLRERLLDGGCAVVVLNTVNQAQQMAEDLRAQLPKNEILLVHAQYMLEDRAEWEQALLRRLGRHSTPQERNGLIVVGTQVIEQSLDIDADVMILELCPMDLMLQRLGRLHRHPRTRPQRLGQAQCAVLPWEDGAQAIYGGWPLSQTERLLPDTVVLPDSIPELVQEAYTVPQAGAEEEPAWRDYEKRLKDQANKAHTFVLDAYRESCFSKQNTLFGMLETDAPDDERYGEAAVRDGRPALEVLMLVRHEDGSIGLVPWHENGRLFSASHVPSFEEALCIARQRIRLPQAICRNIDKAISELENITKKYVPEWQNAGMLRGELFLFLDDRLQARLGDYVLLYQQKAGLKYWKEESDGER